MTPVLAHAGAGLSTYGTDWLYLLVPLAGFFAAVVYLAATGRGGSGWFGRRVLLRVGDSLERVTGMPAWSASGLSVGLFALGVAVIGFYWDVAWHIEIGRDEFLFTPAHMMIAGGLFFIVVAAASSIVFATLKGERVGLTLGPVVIPYASIPIAALGIGALSGFPLDEFWHQSYGIDVTMWGPTHLVMISGASLTPLALWLLIAEGRDRERPTALMRYRRMVLAGAVLLGLSTWAGEFDFGVPQFQQLYHPLLINLAASVGLVFARTVLGPGGAVKAAAGFIVGRVLIALVLGGALNLVIPRFPLYLGAAAAVELATLAARRLSAVRAIVVTGILVGTVGLGVEWGWMQLWGRHPWGSSLFPGLAVVAAVAIPGAILGSAMGDVIANRPLRVRRSHFVLSGIAIVALLAVPFPRHEADIAATLTTRPAGDDRVWLDVAVDPASAADNPDWFEVLSWQGGGLQITPLGEVAKGRFESADPVPVGGDWKSLVRLARKDVLVGVPVYMPEDPAIGASEIPLAPQREAQFERDTELLLREAHGGPSWPAIVAYSAILILTVVWVVALSYAFAAIARRQTATAPTEAAKERIDRRVEAAAR